VPRLIHRAPESIAPVSEPCIQRSMIQNATLVALPETTEPYLHHQVVECVSLDQVVVPCWQHPCVRTEGDLVASDRHSRAVAHHARFVVVADAAEEAQRVAQHRVAPRRQRSDLPIVRPEGAVRNRLWTSPRSLSRRAGRVEVDSRAARVLDRAVGQRHIPPTLDMHAHAPHVPHGQVAQADVLAGQDVDVRKLLPE